MRSKHLGNATCSPYLSICCVEAQHAAGVLRGPEALYDNVTRHAVSDVWKSLPASRGAVQEDEAKFQEYKAKLEERNAQSEEYKKDTAGIINALISKINGLTPVGTHLWHSFRRDMCELQAALTSIPCRDIMEQMA